MRCADLERVFAGLAGVAAGVLLSCGAGSEAQPASQQVQKVFAVERVYTIENLVAAGLKKGKQYDVTGLSGATEAWLGFFGPDPSARKDYEVRFYPSHEAAVRDGTALADEGVGDGMRAKKDSQIWQGGARDRWFTGGVTDVSSGGSRQAPGPKYNDYVIYGNVIMLCQGGDSVQSLETCSALVEALGGPRLVR
jgi:hypothetical protein